MVEQVMLNSDVNIELMGHFIPEEDGSLELNIRIIILRR